MLKFRKIGLSLPFLFLLPVTSLYADDFSSFGDINLLFTDLLDASECLQITPEDCVDIINKSHDYDVALWIAQIVCKPPVLDTCANCYSQIDGINVIGVLPVVHEIIREPAILYGNTTGFTHSYENWNNIAMLNSSGIQTNSLDGFKRNVTAEQIKSFIPGSGSGIYTSNNSSLTLDEVINPYAGSLYTIFNNKVLSVNQDIASHTYDGYQKPLVNIPLPAVINLEAIEYEMSSLGIFTANTINDNTSFVGGTAKENQFKASANTDIGYYYPALTYSNSMDPAVFNTLNLSQCGVTYEIIEKGSVHPDFLVALATEYQRAIDTGEFSYTTHEGFKYGSGNSASTQEEYDGNKGTINTAIGLWSGSNTYIPYDLPILSYDDIGAIRGEIRALNSIKSKVDSSAGVEETNPDVLLNNP